MCKRTASSRAMSFLLMAGLGFGSTAACHRDSSSGKEDAGTSLDGDVGPVNPDDAGPETQVHWTLEPTSPVLIVTADRPHPTVTFQVKRNGQPMPANFSLGRVGLAIIDSGGILTANGTVGGAVEVRATAQGTTLNTVATITFQVVQNGTAKPGDDPGSGGRGGVGGEGPGPEVPAEVRTVLEGPKTADSSFSFLYPYDQTVWPLGQLAPLLQWAAKTDLLANAQGISIHLSANNYEYKGFFGRPYFLAAGSPFQRHPILQEVWDAATKTAAGSTLKVEVTLAANGRAYGPITETWTIARGKLKGVVYYQSYGTHLVKNYDGAKGGDGRSGGATLAIKPGRTAPVLVAGKNSDPGNHSGCRVCHSVSADGSRMVVQHGDDWNAYELSSSIDLKNPKADGTYGEAAYSASVDFKFIGLSSDGKLGLSHSFVPVFPFGVFQNTGLYDMATGQPLAAPGLSQFVTRAVFPAFSPDGKRVAFNFREGPGGEGIPAGDGSRLVTMSVTPSGSSPPTYSFASPKVLYAGGWGKQPLWPSFVPTGDGVVFQVDLGGSAMTLGTCMGGKGEVWWTGLTTGKAVKLNALNGKNLPTGPNGHDSDNVLNYEPTVCPVASGGYAWVVFMSRRLYGNVATIDPWASDPQTQDLTKSVTTKKLWVAAIDLTASPDKDPSHPAFYLPAQELYAGNTRGFWVADPCRPNGASCESGDECCGGYCVNGGNGNECASEPQTCSKEYDHCDDASDCCSEDPPLRCVNQRCAAYIMPPLN